VKVYCYLHRLLHNACYCHWFVYDCAILHNNCLLKLLMFLSLSLLWPLLYDSLTSYFEESIGFQTATPSELQTVLYILICAANDECHHPSVFLPPTLILVLYKQDRTAWPISHHWSLCAGFHCSFWFRRKSQRIPNRISIYVLILYPDLNKTTSLTNKDRRYVTYQMFPVWDDKQ